MFTKPFVALTGQYVTIDTLRIIWFYDKNKQTETVPIIVKAQVQMCIHITGCV